MIDLIAKELYNLPMSRVIRKGSPLTRRASLCDLCGQEAHHTHHKDENNKNNNPANLQPLCTLCHAKLHGIEPRLSELKKRVIYFHKTQKARIAIQLSLKNFERIELQVPEELTREAWNIATTRI